MIREERFKIAFDDGDVAGWRWRNEGAPRLVFCHATGFCALAYRRMLREIGDRFDIIAPDLRGHGGTTLPADPTQLRSWTFYADDIGRLLDRLAATQRGPFLCAGHSLGAVCVTLAAQGRGDIDRLALIEPVTLPPVAALIAGTPFWPFMMKRMPLVRGALSRRAEWPNRAATLESYARKRLFASWADGCLQDYVEDGLVEAGAGYRLACAPAWEAATFAAQKQDFWKAALTRPGALRVLAADSRDSTVFFGAHARFAKAGVAVTKVSGAGHLIPMENPRVAAEFLATALLN